MSDETRFVKVDSWSNLPAGVDEELLVSFFHTTMEPWQDTRPDVSRALHDALDGTADRNGGFLMLAMQGTQLAGGLLMLETGMKGYIPENLLLFVSIQPEMRGQGLGRRLVETSLAACKGQVKLHVDFENPAKRLYERLGFKHVYAEMRLKR